MVLSITKHEIRLFVSTSTSQQLALATWRLSIFILIYLLHSFVCFLRCVFFLPVLQAHSKAQLFAQHEEEHRHGEGAVHCRSPVTISAFQRLLVAGVVIAISYIPAME